MPTNREVMHMTIGLAVEACQIFEFSLVTCVTLVFEQQDAESLAEVRAIKHSDFKVPTKNLLDRLAKVIDVDSSFSGNVLGFSERRHTLIHRWLIQKGWPETPEQEREMTEYASCIVSDAKKLSVLMNAQLAKWLERFPEFRNDHERLLKEFADAANLISGLSIARV